ncbi:hypothetical protein [Acinetobacter soli]|uniref:hypothetical protein n=1 Tax=Acinetobacter soli TaxID=487316 RepID=UPI000E6AAA1D|nr:hypothetical protein [Acinetobacter soli]
MKRTMILGFVLLFGCATSLYADKNANDFQKKYEAAAQDAKKLTNKEIMGKIALIYDMNRNESTFTKALRATPYATELNTRGDAGDYEAKYISNSVWKLSLCENMVEHEMLSASETCSDVIENLKYIANLKLNKKYVAGSMITLGDIYKKGVASGRSETLAAEWYYRAGKKYNEIGDRDEAIKSLDKSLQESPDYEPARKYLRELTLKETK